MIKSVKSPCSVQSNQRIAQSWIIGHFNGLMFQLFQLFSFGVACFLSMSRIFALHHLCVPAFTLAQVALKMNLRHVKSTWHSNHKTLKTYRTSTYTNKQSSRFSFSNASSTAWCFIPSHLRNGHCPMRFMPKILSTLSFFACCTCTT